MTKYIIRRILIAIPVMLAIIFFTFLLIRAVPGGPFDFSGSKSTPESIRRALEQRYGLDLPFLLNLPFDTIAPDHDLPRRVIYPALADCDELRRGVPLEQARPATNVVDEYEGWQLLRIVTERRETTITIGGRQVRCLQASQVLYSDLFLSQFFGYLNNVLRLDFGLSVGRTTLGQPVNDLIADRLPVSVRLGLLAVFIGFAIGVPLGVLAALYRNSPIDYGVTFFAGTIAAIPTLVLGPILIIVLVVQWRVLPPVDPRVWKQLSIFDWNFISVAILPVGVLGIGISAGLARLTRASVLQVLRDDYIRTARAKGLRERIVIYVHALKNALIPVATVVGPLLAGVLTGSLIIERLFAIPGLGDVFVTSIAARDYTMLLGVTILYSVFLILGNILVDVIYTWLDPRIRFD
jgi:ABC-type dipeptide/oligopeptide/nickel transport system permease component